MPTVRSEIRSADGTVIPVWISGEGRPLLVVHGAVSDHTAFDLLREQLESHLTFAAIDRRATFCDPFSHYDLEREFEDIAAVAEGLGPEVDIFGHSAGAICSLGAALRIPNLRRLVLYEPALRDKPSSWSALARTMRELQGAGDLNAVFELWVQGFSGAPASAAKKVKDSPVGAELFRWARTLPVETEALAGWSCNPEALTALRAPTMYVIGAKTPRGSHGYISLLKHRVPDFRVLEVEGQGHFAHLLAPDRLASGILKFLKPDVSPGSAGS